MRRLAPIVLILGLASQAFAQQVSPPAVIGPVFEPETLRSSPVEPLITGPRVQRLPLEVVPKPGEPPQPSVSEFVRSLTAPCDPDLKPGDPAEPNAAPACPPPNEVYTTRPPFAPPRRDLHPDYGKGRLYPLAPL